MKTWYIKFEQIYTDPVWGMQGTGIRSPLVRITRNRLRKGVFEWVSTSKPIDSVELYYYRRAYPLVHMISPW